MENETLGQFLRREREFRGLTLEDISQQTKISIRFLKCIEADLWNDLPEGAFIRGFLRCTAQAIGVPREEVMRRFESLQPKESSLENPFRKFRGIEVKNQFFIFLVFAIVVILLAAYLSSR
ncbi:MAG: helix-turn-helix domain-containing protein [Deltaproteobacteria bacterium]|nr:helix-turn-helix domain-containing protein [Deltaproteobacteria bacterium]